MPALALRYPDFVLKLSSTVVAFRVGEMHAAPKARAFGAAWADFQWPLKSA